MAVTVNPPSNVLGRENAILWGRGHREYHVREFPGPLSIKTVVSGMAMWAAGGRRHAVNRTHWLILNDQQPYSIDIEGPAPTETLCVFFAGGFVEGLHHAGAHPDAALLDDPFPAGSEEVGFAQRLWPKQDRISTELASLYRKVQAGDRELEDDFILLGQCVLEVRVETAREQSRLPGLRASTREELHRRITRALSLMEDRFSDALPLEQVAREACLSPFHLHRSFQRAFGKTPHEFLQSRRLAHAAFLLAETEQPATGICLDCGFSSLGTFSSLFRSRFGCSPREYRAREKARSKKFFLSA